jgi:hypothetical protein
MSIWELRQIVESWIPWYVPLVFLVFILVCGFWVFYNDE